MKHLLLPALLSMAVAWAQPEPTAFQTVFANPAGQACNAGQGVLYAATGAIYTCIGSVFAPLPPVSGGLGGNVNVPPQLRYLGEGTDGAVNCSGNTYGIKYATTFNVDSGNMCTINGPSVGLTVYATGACTIAGTINSRGVDGGNGAAGDAGGYGGGGGGGTAAGGASGNQFINGVAIGSPGTAGTSAGGAGGAGFSSSSSAQRQAWTAAFGYFHGGSPGGAGGTGAAAGGKAGLAVVLVCASVNFSGTIDVSGATGTPSAATNNGAGGGGGAGYVWLVGRDSVTNTGTVYAQGAPGGQCYATNIVLSTPTTALSGMSSGTGAVAHVSTYAGGNPTVATVDAAGSGYNYTPACAVVSTAGSGATCTAVMAGVAPSMTLSSVTLTGGAANYGTGTTYTNCGVGGYGANGWMKTAVMQ